MYIISYRLLAKYDAVISYPRHYIPVAGSMTLYYTILKVSLLQIRAD